MLEVEWKYNFKKKNKRKLPTGKEELIYVYLKCMVRHQIAILFRFY